MRFYLGALLRSGIMFADRSAFVILQGADLKTGPSFSFSNRAMRAVWGMAWLVLFRPTPRTANRWRQWILRLFGAKLGQNFRIHGSCKVWAPWQLRVGDFVSVGEGAHFYNMAPITVGDRAVISQGAHLCAGTHDYNSPNFQLIAKPITVGHDAWICTEAFIGPGVDVPPGCVVGARSVMTRSPVDGAWQVFAGNPVKKIKHRQIRA